MTTLITAIWLFFIGLFGFTPNHISHSSHPSADPEQSAPQQTIVACIDKIAGQSCSFIMEESEVEGACSVSGDTLACGPTFIETTY